MDLRKTLTLKISGVDVEVNVDFRAIEIVETVFGKSADHVIAVDLVQPQMIRRNMVAKVIREWVKPTAGGLTREQVYEAVITADRQSLPKFVGAIQGAVAYALKYIGEDEMQALASGEDLAKEASQGGEVNKGNLPSSPSATG